MVEENKSNDKHIRFLILAQATCGTFISLSFGMALGWTSVALPHLLDPKAFMSTTLEQTALIAGSVLHGNALGAFFSTIKFTNRKTAILMASCLQLLGWVFIYTSGSLLQLYSGRFLVGLANSFGAGQLRKHLERTCDPGTSDFVVKFVHVGVSLGVLVMYLMGVVVGFEEFALVAVAVRVVGLFCTALVPMDPDLVARKGILKSEKTYKTSNQRSNYSIRQRGIKETLNDGKTMKALMMLLMIVLVQCFTGGPLHLVFIDYIQKTAENSHHQTSTVLYFICNFISTAFGTYFTSGMAFRPNLLDCTALTTTSLSFLTLYFHFKTALIAASAHFAWTPTALLMSYNFFHAFEIAAMPGAYVDEVVGRDVRDLAVICHVVFVSVFAMVSTKVFQMLFSWNGLDAAYGFCAVIGLASFVGVVFYFEEPMKIDKHAGFGEKALSGDVV